MYWAWFNSIVLDVIWSSVSATNSSYIGLLRVWVRVFLLKNRCASSKSLSHCSSLKVKTRSWFYKTFFGGNLDFPKIKKLNKVGFAAWTCQHWLKQCYFHLNCIQTLFICSKMVYSCSFGLRGNLYFPDFLQIKFYNINYRTFSNYFKSSQISAKGGPKQHSFSMRILRSVCIVPLICAFIRCQRHILELVVCFLIKLL